MEIKDKTFVEVVGSIVPSTILYGKQEVEYKTYWGDTRTRLRVSLSFKLDTKEGKTINVLTDDESIFTKMGTLYKFSFSNLLETSDDRQITEFLNQTILDKPRSIVLLFKENDQELKNPVSIVSERHSQIKLSVIAEAVRKVAKEEGIEELNVTESGGSYKLNFKTGTGKLMDYTVSVHLGRNDAKGKAGVHFNNGGGTIAVCSNQIVPHHSKIYQTKVNKLFTIKNKIVHTGDVSQRVLANIQTAFKSSVAQSKELEKLLEESMNIPISREQQQKLLKLISIRHRITDTAYYWLRNQLKNEDESLYGLSQTLTWVGTHKYVGSGMKDLLKKLGGQVLLIGKDLPQIVEQAHETYIQQQREKGVV